MPSPTRKKRKRSSQRDGFTLRSIESLFSRHLLKIIGVLFLGASLWFAANSSDTLIKIAKNLLSPTELISGQGSSPTPTDQQSQVQITPKPSSTISVSVILLVFATLIGWLGLQWLTRWRKRAEFQIISVFLVFLVILVLIRNYGWQVELYFSFLILISAGLYFFGRHLSHTGTRINFVFTWGLFALWWLLKIMINSERDQLVSLFTFASLLFLTFHIILLLDGFAGHRTLSKHVEVGAIGMNLFVYFAIIAATLLKFYSAIYIFFFTLALSGVYVATLLMMDQWHRQFRKVPFQICTLILLSLLLPLLFHNNQIILLTGSLSILLMIYSKQTKDQPSIIIALGLVALMLLVFSKDILFSYFPAAFLGGLMDNSPLFYKGLVASLFIALVAFTDRRMLKKLDIKYSRKWFSRRRYMKLLKGVYLAGLYVGLFWIWQYFWYAMLQETGIQFLSWFTYHCLFFIVAIPWLATQRSSFLSIAILVSTILTLIYPTLLSLQNITLLDHYIRDIPSGLLTFTAHYIPAGFFLIFLAVILQYTGKAFKENTLAKRIFLIYAVFMFLFVLISEMILIGISITAEEPHEVVEIQKQLVGFPATLIMAAVGWIILAWGFIRHKRFVRTLALILLIVAAVKLIYFDLKSMDLLTRIILLFVTGTVFIAASLVYNRVRKSFKKKRRHKSPSRKPKFHKDIASTEKQTNETSEDYN